MSDMDIGLSRSRSRNLTIFATLLSMIAPLSINTYLPSFPDSEAEFGISRVILSQSLAVYLLAFIFYAHLIPDLRSLGTALLAGVSVMTVIIGLAAQATLGNLIAGTALLLYRPFRVGDRLQINAPTGVELGTVESLTLGYTVLQTFDNRRIVVPNSVMVSQITINLTHSRVLTQIPISIDYAADIEQARYILTELAGAHPLVEAVVNCPVTQIDTTGVTLTLRVWCANIGDARQVEFDLYERAKERFDQEGIERPSTFQTVVLEKEA